MLLLTTTIYDVSIGIKVVCGRYQDVWIVTRGDFVKDRNKKKSAGRAIQRGEQYGE